MEYTEKLKDPRWQRKRLEIFELRGWKCQCCESTTNTLTVHHLKYFGEPWECPNELLECICQDCHDVRTDFDDLFGRSELPTWFCVIVTRIVKEAQNNVGIVKSWKCFPADVLPHIRKISLRAYESHQVTMHEHKLI